MHVFSSMSVISRKEAESPQVLLEILKVNKKIAKINMKKFFPALTTSSEMMRSSIDTATLKYMNTPKRINLTYSTLRESK